MSSIKKNLRKLLRRARPKSFYEFLERNKDSAFFSKEIAEALKEKDVKPPDIMTSVRRLERKRLVYVR